MKKRTKTDFNLSSLTELYIQRLCGLAHSRRNNEDLPTYVVYQEVMEILEGTHATSEYGKEMAKKYKDKIIGKTALMTAPSRYFEIGAVLSMSISPVVWDGYAIHERAELMARRYVENMIAVVDSHYKEADDRAERENKKTAGKTQIAGNDSDGE